MMDDFDAYIGLDVHKDTVAVALAAQGRGRPEYLCELRNGGDVVARLLKRVSGHGQRLSFCYEAGPCGYGLWRELTALGHHCLVAAPSLIPRRPGNRVKTDRRDALALAGLHRAGELVAVRVPDSGDEAVRDLTRAREDMKAVETAARNRLRWSTARGRAAGPGATSALQFEHPEARDTMIEYLDAVRDAGDRVARVGKRVGEAVSGWSHRRSSRRSSRCAGSPPDRHGSPNSVMSPGSTPRQSRPRARPLADPAPSPGPATPTRRIEAAWSASRHASTFGRRRIAWDALCDAHLTRRGIPARSTPRDGSPHTTRHIGIGAWSASVDKPSTGLSGTRHSAR